MKPSSKRPKGSFFTAIEGMKKVKKGGFAFYIDTATGYKMAQVNFPDYSEIRKNTNMEVWGIG